MKMHNAMTSDALKDARAVSGFKPKKARMWKRWANRKYRRQMKQAVKEGNYDYVPLPTTDWDII